MKIDKKQIYDEVESKFSNPNYSTETSLLASECMKHAEEWLQQAGDFPFKNKRELRKDLKKYIMDRVDLQDAKRSYFIPSFIWIFLAGQIISYIVRLIVERYTEGAQD
jgi:hypothetical protein